MGENSENSDRELWREIESDYYAPSIHVTQQGGIGINVAGSVFVKPLREWHRLAASPNRGKVSREQIDRVAKAIYKAGGDDEYNWASAPKHNRDWCLKEAVVAVRALGLEIEGLRLTRNFQSAKQDKDDG